MRYITYEPWPGLLNNTRRCFETVVSMAAVLGRTLVIPDCFAPTRGNVWLDRRAWPHPAWIYDFDVLRQAIDVIESKAGERGAWDTGHADDTFTVSEEPCTAVLCHPHVPEPETPEHDRLRAFAVTRERFLALPAHHAQIRTIHFRQPFELFYAFLFLPPAEDLRAKRLVRESLAFRPEFLALAARALDGLTDFDAVHVRRTDFVHQYGPWVDLAPARVAAALERAIEPGRTVYIATDEPDASYFSVVKERYRVLFLRDLIDTRDTGDAREEAIACAEQLICARARRFVGTRLSTFSSYVTRLRGYDQVRDQGIYFTDGQSAFASTTADRFSWASWMRAGLPLWGREFEESWRVPS